MADANSTPTLIADPSTIPEWGATDWESMNQDEFANNLLAKMEGEEAILTCEEMDIIEKFWDVDRRNRRCSLVMLTKPFSWLREQVENDDDFAQSVAAMNVCLDASKYEQIANLLHDAQRRLMCAIACREDMSALLDKAKAETDPASV